MEYRVGELAIAAGVSVDTVRFYQARGLLPPPRREGRAAVYDTKHLRTLRRIRELADQGLSLKVIKRLLDSGSGGTDRRLLAAVEGARGERRLTRAELAAATGVPEALLHSAEAAGLWGGAGEGEAAYTEADVELVRLGLSILDAGLPLDRLLAIATQFTAHLDETADAAVDLFNESVRRGEDADPASVVAAFTSLLPAVTGLVALAFQRTLVAKGRARLLVDAEADADARALADAIGDTAPPVVELRWRRGAAT